MTDEQINTAIAEVCGWTLFIECLNGIRGVPPNVTVITPIYIPNYCADLNAMHKAEEHLRGNQFLRYAEMLDDIIGSLGGIRATAHQRAEAFLKTLGKWEEVQG